MTTTTTDDTVQVPRIGRYEIDAQGSTMTFKSRHLVGLAPVHGTMAIRRGLVDVARPVSLAIERSIVQPGTTNSFVVCATTRTDRSEFGLTAAKGLAGRHLDVSLRILGVRR
jgi:polyisoprenoid-binding protein YceI